LHWYYRYWIQTTKRIDYGVGSVTEVNGNTLVELQRIGEFPMPIDLLVTYKDGSKELFYIPLNEQLGVKPIEDKNLKRTTLADWPWVYPTYNVQLNRKSGEIQSIEIDANQRLADINRKNNLKVLTEAKPFSDPTQ
jgi:hypothetical protein